MTPENHMPLAPHEMMRAIFPKLKPLITGIIPKCRNRLTKAGTINFESLSSISQFSDFVNSQARDFYYKLGYSEEDARDEGDLLGQHGYYMTNFEIHHRKMFWVDGLLAEMFHHTGLDIEGDSLRLPFPACAYSFTDAPSLALGREMMDLDENLTSGTRTPTILTAYMIAEDGVDGGKGLTAFILLGCRDDDWPYMISRSMMIHAHDRLDVILESHPPSVRPSSRDPIFTSSVLKKILHLIFNAILYSTTQDLAQVLMPSPIDKLKARRKKAKGKKKQALEKKYREAKKAYSEDDVFYLPGKIDIVHRLSENPEEQPEHGEGQLTFRFMVRGHWRKANPTWKSQEVRWIQPYYKGPEDAPIVEKDYRLKT